MKKRSNTWLLLGLPIFALAVAYLGMTDSNTHSNTQRSPASTEAGKMNDNIKVDKPNLESANKELRIEVHALPEEDINADPAKHAEALEAMLATAQPEKIMQHFAQLRRQRAAKIQAQMDIEGADDDWSYQMQEYFALSSHLLPAVKELQLEQSDCRETICALTVNLNQKRYQDIRVYLDNIGNVLGLDSFVHHDAKPDRAVMYFARENHRLPDLDMNLASSPFANSAN